MENEREGVIIQGLDIVDVIRIIDKKKNKFLAISLQEIEEINLDEKDFEIVRKVFLDSLNDFTRSVMRALLGDIEVLPYNDG